MVYLERILRFEVQSTFGATSRLLFKEVGNAFGCAGLFPSTSCPIEPIAVVGAAASLNFNMASNRGLIMSVERDTVYRSEGPRALFDAPVFSHRPFSGFAGMSANSPSFEFQVGEVAHFLEGTFG